MSGRKIFHIYLYIYCLIIIIHRVPRSSRIFQFLWDIAEPTIFRVVPLHWCTILQHSGFIELEVYTGKTKIVMKLPGIERQQNCWQRIFLLHFQPHRKRTWTNCQKVAECKFTWFAEVVSLYMYMESNRLNSAISGAKLHSKIRGGSSVEI